MNEAQGGGNEKRREFFFFSSSSFEVERRIWDVFAEEEFIDGRLMMN